MLIIKKFLSKFKGKIFCISLLSFYLYLVFVFELKRTWIKEINRMKAFDWETFSSSSDVKDVLGFGWVRLWLMHDRLFGCLLGINLVDGDIFCNSIMRPIFLTNTSYWTHDAFAQYAPILVQILYGHLKTDILDAIVGVFGSVFKFK